MPLPAPTLPGFALAVVFTVAACGDSSPSNAPVSPSGGATGLAMSGAGSGGSGQQTTGAQPQMNGAGGLSNVGGSRGGGEQSQAGAPTAGKAGSASGGGSSGTTNGGAGTTGGGGGSSSAGSQNQAGMPNVPGQYSTEFELTESPISEGGKWKHLGLDWTKVVTEGGLAHGTQTGNGGYDDSYAYLSGFPADQKASGVVHIDPAIAGNTTHEVEILLRWVDTDHTVRGYECNFAYNGQYADIVRWNGPKDSFTYLVPTLTASIPGGLHDGDVVSAQIVGTTITTFVNGEKILSVDDTMFQDGNPGIGFFRGGPSTPLSDFGFKSFTAAPITK